MTRVVATSVRGFRREWRAGERPHGPYPRIELVAETQIQLWRRLGAVRMPYIREPHGAEKNRIGLAGAAIVRLGERLTGVPVQARSPGHMLELEREAAGAPASRLEHLDGRAHDLFSDAIAGQDRNVKRVVGLHGNASLRDTRR